MTFRDLAFAITLCSGGLPAFGAFATCADLALVLAIDSSGSIDHGEFALQRAGYVAAFKDRRVLAALDGAGIVDVAAVFWGDEETVTQVLPFRRIAGPEDADLFAADIAALHRQVTGDTGIGKGLWTALDLLEEEQPCAVRRIVNVSGDGKESYSPRSRSRIPLVLARTRAAEMGVTVNGLAITGPAGRDSDWGLPSANRQSSIAEWYRTRVITGADAFLMTANSFESFGEAITRKLAREIALPVLAAATGAEVRP